MVNLYIYIYSTEKVCAIVSAQQVCGVFIFYVLSNFATAARERFFRVLQVFFVIVVILIRVALLKRTTLDCEQGGRKDGRGNEPLPLRNVRCAEPPEDSVTWP